MAIPERQHDLVRARRFYENIDGMLNQDDETEVADMAPRVPSPDRIAMAIAEARRHIEEGGSERRS